MRLHAANMLVLFILCPKVRLASIEWNLVLEGKDALDQLLN